MKLPKDIFKSTKEYLDFLLFLNSKEEFKITEIEEKFDITYPVLYGHITHWADLKLIIKDTFPPKLGGPRLKFWLSEEAKSKLKSFLKLLSSGLQFKKNLLENLQQNLTSELNKKVGTIIESFYNDFFK